ncbi:hypothetical protein EBU95_20060, partial [bacterium]|nr:hypothetical protein [bacterium]
MGVTGATGATNKIIYNPATTANQWIKVDPSYNMLHNGSSCQSEKSNVLTDVMIRRNIDAQRKLDRFLNLDVQGFKFPIKFSLDYESEDCINVNNDLQTVNNELSFISPFLTRTVEYGSFSISSFVTFNSPVPIIYSSSNPAVATISGSTVTIVGVVGSTIITASQVASNDGIYPPGVATIRLDVTLVTPILSNFIISSRNFNDIPFSIIPNTHTILFLRTGGSDWKTRIINNDTSYVNLIDWIPNNEWFIELSNQIAEQFQFFAAYVTTFYNISSASCMVVSAYGDLGIYSFVSNGGISYTGTFNKQQETWNYALPFNVNINSLQPTSNSPGAFSYTSSNIKVATVQGRVVTIVGAGTTNITATQAAVGNYSLATITAPFVVNPIAPTLRNFRIDPRYLRDPPFTLNRPETNSDGAFTYTSSNTAVANVNNKTVTIMGLGGTIITARQEADGNYKSGIITAEFVVNPNIPPAPIDGDKLIDIVNRYIYPTLNNFIIDSRNFRDLPFGLTRPTSDSPGVFSYTSSNTNVATVQGNIVTIVGGGTTYITAIQEEVAIYESNVVIIYRSANITTEFVVNPIAPRLSNFTIERRNVGDLPFALKQPTSDSDGAFTYTSSNRAVAIVEENTVTIIGEGTTSITAMQAATDNYTSGSIVTPFVVTIPGMPFVPITPVPPLLSNFAVNRRNFRDLPFFLDPPN